MNDIDAVLRAAREEFEPSPADRARVKQRLLVRAAGVGLLASLVTKGSLGATQASSFLGGQSLAALSKLFVGSMLVTFAGAGVVVAVSRGFTRDELRPSPAHAAGAPSAVVRARVAAPPAALAPNASTSAAAPPVSRAAGSVGSFAALSPAPETTPRAVPTSARLEAELVLLREARLASKSGNVEEARRVLDALDRDHPAGVLLEERSALRAVTECAAAPGGTARANAFLQRYPSSVYAANVRRACQLGSKSAPASSPSPGATATFTDLPEAGH